ncbi:MAG: hypothetical protein Q7S22_01630 [Candidatus Micrarchaeota archaeon]|nr:hypothetical protein [Candidatus Micrarchaeota archaeon]
MQLFFSVAGESNNADQLLGAIWNSYRHTNRENPNESESFGFTANLKGPELDEWAATELSGYDTVAVSAMQQAIRDYFRIRSMVTFNRALSHTGSQRNSFIVREGFAYLGTNLYNGTNELYAGSGSIEFKFIPGFMQSDYSILLKNPLLSTMVNDGSGHFSTVDDFKNFIPYVQSFVDWMKRRYPVLNDLGQ